MNPNIRKPNETQKAFRARRKNEQKTEKHRAKGRVAWDSASRGTYKRKREGNVEAKP